jgi:hypothetical protein
MGSFFSASLGRKAANFSPTSMKASAGVTHPPARWLGRPTGKAFTGRQPSRTLPNWLDAAERVNSTQGRSTSQHRRSTLSPCYGHSQSGALTSWDLFPGQLGDTNGCTWRSTSSRNARRLSRSSRLTRTLRSSSPGGPFRGSK